MFIRQEFDDEDPDVAKQALASLFIKYVNIKYTRLARHLPLLQCTKSKCYRKCKMFVIQTPKIARFRRPECKILKSNALLNAF